MEQTPQMIVVATVSQPLEATPVQVKLGSFGIESQLNGEMTIAANPLLSNAVGGIHVLVSESDAERAIEILAQHHREESEAEARRARSCPECGNENGVLVKRPIVIAILAVITIGAFCLLYPWPRYRCPDCRHKWR
jgi:hypothetical protein